jgi:hypothetical protein
MFTRRITNAYLGHPAEDESRAQLIRTAAVVSPRLAGKILPHLLRPLQEHRHTTQALLADLTTIGTWTTAPLANDVPVQEGVTEARTGRSGDNAAGGSVDAELCPSLTTGDNMTNTVEEAGAQPNVVGVDDVLPAEDEDTVGSNSEPVDADSNDPVSLPVAEEIACRLEHLRGSDAVLRASSAEILARLVDDAGTAAVLAASGDMALWMQLLDSGTDAGTVVAAKALRSLMMLANSTNQTIFLEAGTIPLLVNVLNKSATDAAKEAVTRLLGMMAVKAEDRKVTAQAGAVPPLVRLLRDGTERAKELAAAILGHLSKDVETCRTVLAEGALPLLAQMIGHGPPTSRKRALAAMWCVSCHSECHEAIAATGTVPLIVDELKMGGHETQWMAVEILRKMAVSLEGCKAVRGTTGWCDM